MIVSITSHIRIFTKQMCTLILSAFTNNITRNSIYVFEFDVFVDILFVQIN